VIRAVAWDIDGTLVDSEPRHHRALLAASRAMGVRLDDLPDQAFRGVHMLDVWEELRPRYPAGLARDAWLDAINVAYARDAEPLVPISGAAEAIRALSDAGLRQVCVSNSNRVIVDANIAALQIGGFLSGSISLDDVGQGKPDPEPYIRACDMLGLPPEAVAAVEDSATGIASAKAAGLVAVAYGSEAGDEPVAIRTSDLADIPRLLGVCR
jgi:HAD superfamily hydrolase (TIGR01509 family)